MPDKNIQYRLAKIVNNQFAIFEDKYAADEPMAFELKTGFGANIDEHIIIAQVNFTVIQKEFVLLTIECSFFYQIEPESFLSLMDKETKNITLPFNYAATFMTTAIGGTRGYLSAKLEDSSLQNFILPIVFLNELWDTKDDFVLEYTKDLKTADKAETDV